MKLIRYKLGELIEQSDERNKDDVFTSDDVVGLSTQKMMIETKADLEGVKLSSYKVFPQNYFAYVADTSRRGDKISLAFNNKKRTFIVSSISTVFRVNRLEVLSSEYLFMYFNRPEFDRYTRFNSWGSARETFDWDEMCSIDIDLPPLPIQEKVIAIYNGLVKNQQSYERGLEDLKLVCDAHFDVIKKDKSLCKKLGNYIEKNEQKNTRNIYSELNVRGISNSKEFISTKADVSKTDLSKFLVIPKNGFAFNSRTDGRDMLVLAKNDCNEAVIVTWNYSSFNIKEDKLQDIIPDYLYAFLKRTEFDRLVRFMSWGSSQELYSWDSLCDVKISLPDIKEQESIANIYKVYKKRKDINEKLKQQIKDICPILIKGSVEEAKALMEA